MHCVRGALGDVLALGPCLFPDLSPRAPHSPRLFTLRNHSLEKAPPAQAQPRDPDAGPLGCRRAAPRAGGRSWRPPSGSWRRRRRPRASRRRRTPASARPRRSPCLGPSPSRWVLHLDMSATWRGAGGGKGGTRPGCRSRGGVGACVRPNSLGSLATSRSLTTSWCLGLCTKLRGGRCAAGCGASVVSCPVGALDHQCQGLTPSGAPAPLERRPRRCRSSRRIARRTATTIRVL